MANENAQIQGPPASLGLLQGKPLPFLSGSPAVRVSFAPSEEGPGGKNLDSPLLSTWIRLCLEIFLLI